MTLNHSSALPSGVSSDQAAARYWRQAAGSGRPGRRVIWVTLFGLCAFLLLILMVFREVSGQFTALNQQRLSLLQSRSVLAALAELTDIQQRSMAAVAVYVQTDAARLSSRQGLVSFGEMHNRQRQQFLTKITALQSMVSSVEDRVAAEKLAQMGNAYLGDLRELIDGFDSGQRGMTLVRRLNANADKLAEMRMLIDAWREREVARIYQSDRQSIQQLAMARMIAGTIMAISALLVVMLAWLMLRHSRQRDLMEQRLRLASQLWNSTLDSLQQGVGLYTMDRCLMLWNPRLLELQGIDPEQLYPGIAFVDAMRLSKQLPQSSEHLDRFMANNYIEPFEVERLDGVILQISLRRMDIDHFVVTLTDVTAIRRSEQLARDRATRLSAIMDSTMDGIVTINSSGSIESWSVGAEHMFGYISDEILRRDVRLLLAEPYASDQHGYLQRCLDGREPELLTRHTELEMRRKDASSFPVDLNIREMNIDGRRVLVATIRDITERRAVERMKGEFVSTVSHELRTPLTSIAGSLALLTTGAGGSLSERAGQLVDIANRNSKRLTVLINDILELEKADAGKLNLNMQSQSLLPLVQYALEANRAYADQFQVHLELRDAALEPVALLDEIRIQQVMANLLSNAIKFSPPGATVLIEVVKQNGAVRVTVHDDGPGIPENFHARLFMRFAQADSTNARRSGGTGLGLAITKTLVELHGGQIGFDSGHSAVGRGQGASFWFQLPLVRVVDELDSQSISTTLQGTHIMVCDDDPDITKLLCVLLQQHGCVVEVVNSTFAASEQLQRRPPDLLLVDMHLPDSDGLTLVARLRQQPRLQQMAIVILSAIDCAELDLAMLETLDVSSCLRKPFNDNSLCMAVAQALRLKQA